MTDGGHRRFAMEEGGTAWGGATRRSVSVVIMRDGQRRALQRHIMSRVSCWVVRALKRPIPLFSN